MNSGAGFFVCVRSPVSMMKQSVSHLMPDICVQQAFFATQRVLLESFREPAGAPLPTALNSLRFSVAQVTSAWL